MGLDANSLKARLIRVELESGETEILATSLTDMKKYPIELFSDLYHCRWPVEEDYKTLKYRLQVENFSGKTIHSVYQDFHAKVFSKNMASVIAGTTKKEISIKSKSLLHIHQINFAQALSQMKNTIVLLFKRPIDKMTEIVEDLRTIFIQTTEAIRPNRKYPRTHRVKQKRFFLEYKTTCLGNGIVYRLIYFLKGGPSMLATRSGRFLQIFASFSRSCLFELALFCFEFCFLSSSYQ